MRTAWVVLVAAVVALGVGAGCGDDDGTGAGTGTASGDGVVVDQPTGTLDSSVMVPSWGFEVTFENHSGPLEPGETIPAFFTINHETIPDVRAAHVRGDLSDLWLTRVDYTITRNTLTGPVDLLVTVGELRDAPGGDLSLPATVATLSPIDAQTPASGTLKIDTSGLSGASLHALDDLEFSLRVEARNPDGGEPVEGSVTFDLTFHQAAYTK